MAPRNLHEAFEQAERSRRKTVPRPAEAGGVGASEGGGGSGEVVRFLRQPLAWLVLVVVFGLGYLVGQGGRPEVEATGGPSELVDVDEEPRGSHGPRELVPTESLGDSYLVDVEVQLDDLSNQYTVQVASYDRTDRNMRLAQDLVSHLAANDFPVAPPQRVGDSHLVVLVGASPTREALAGLLARVRVFEDAAGRARFQDALIRHIDSLLDRE